MSIWIWRIICNVERNEEVLFICSYFATYVRDAGSVVRTGETMRRLHLLLDQAAFCDAAFRTSPFESEDASVYFSAGSLSALQHPF